ncbi:PAAR domain-containing protein [Rahnella selenatireducens]|uniref:PAAR domain-containing protein n=1 Tax=Rahnella selenatireducens TaxID=3389797 RepID=UPI0039685DE6
MKGLIRLGDPHNHGGTVITASGAVFAGKPVMLVGDKVSCSQHGTVPVNQGHPTWKMRGKAVIVDGCTAQCGCVLRTTLTNAGAQG